VTGLMTGQYKLYGGVIRHAAGTEYAGQIVRHLLPVAAQTLGGSFLEPVSGVFGAVNTYQLHRLSGLVAANAQQLQALSGQVSALTTATQQVLQIATGTMVLSGLNLTVSAVGFAVLNEKLKSLEGRLNALQAEVKAIRTLLELEERARLGAALRDLLNVVNIKNEDHRQTMLFNSKNVLAPISLKYKELLAAANSLELAMAYEEYYCLTSLAHARCLAELGMLELASRDLEETNTFWTGQARRIANEFLLGAQPERFLFSDFAEDVPVSRLVEWLDFAYDEEKGYRWLDELRGKTGRWYAGDDYGRAVKGTEQVFSSVGKMFSKRLSAVTVDEMGREKERVIPSFQRLVARHNVLEGYQTQYELLDAHNMRPSEFEKETTMLIAEAVDGYLILQPEQAVH
ncbi:MAG TPA: hypothetical protein PKD98_08665, partial [Anaerolineae bacterium]|nr:hypothetical protein [Anaerolineae bacterium]